MIRGTKKGREVVRALEKQGWVHVRTVGSHRVFVRNDQRYIFSFQDSDELGSIMLGRIAKQTGITSADF